MAEQAVILLAEDEEDYVLLMREAFSKANIANPVYVVWNGEEAISYLQGKGKYANRDEYPLAEHRSRSGLRLKDPGNTTRADTHLNPRIEPEHGTATSGCSWRVSLIPLNFLAAKEIS